jgi:hypothetical protein
MTEIGKAVLAAFSRIAAGSAKGFFEKRKVQQVVRLSPRPVDEKRISEVISSLSSESISNLASFIDTPDFREICVRIVAEVVCARNIDRANVGQWGVADELKVLIRLRSPELSEQNLDKVVAALSGQVLDNAMEVLADNQVSATLSNQISGYAVRSAALQASAVKSNISVLQRIAELESIYEFERILCHQIAFSHSKMRLPRWGSKKYVPYEKIFVQPVLHLSDADKSDDGVGTLDELMRTAHRCVVLGDPGGGKTTLAMKLAHDLGKGAVSGFGDRTPLIVVLRQYGEALKRESTSIVEHIEDVCRGSYQAAPPSFAIEYLLHNGRAFVVFDGLDELTDTALRADVVNAVHAFASRYPQAPILVTSRRVGYEEAPLDPAEFTASYLGEFTTDQINDYCMKWFKQQDDLDSGRTFAREASVFLRDSSVVPDLRSNPLMLSLLCGIYSIDGYIPKNRPEVYEKCATLLFERWDKDRGVVVPLPFDAHVRSAMYGLAFWMYQDENRQSGLTREKLVKHVADYLFDRRFTYFEEAEAAAEKFVDFCTGRAWMLTDIGSDPIQPLYGFTHRTFLEYFAAQYLVRQSLSAEKLFSQLSVRIDNAEWDVVSQLSLQILNNLVEDGGDQFLRLLLAGSPSRSAIRFAARALAFLVPRPTTIELIAELCITSEVRLLGRTTESSYRDGRAFTDVLYCAAEVVPMVWRKFYEMAWRGISAEDCRYLQAALGVVDAYRDSRYSAGSPKMWVESRANLVEEAKDHIVELSETELWAADIALRRGFISLQDYLQHFDCRELFSHLVSRPYFKGSFATDLMNGVMYSWGDSKAVHDPVDTDYWFEGDSRIEELARVLASTPAPWYRHGKSISLYLYPAFDSRRLAQIESRAERQFLTLMSCFVYDHMTIVANISEDPRGGYEKYVQSRNDYLLSIVRVWNAACVADNLLDTLGVLGFERVTCSFLVGWANDEEIKLAVV